MPVVFTAGDERYPIKATTLSVEADWAPRSDGRPRGRGLRAGPRLPPPPGAVLRRRDRAAGAGVRRRARLQARRLAEAIDQHHVEAKLVRRGLAIEVVPGQTGRRLDQKAAGATIVRALARLERGQPVALPVRIDPIEVTAADLAPAARQAAHALSAPVRLEYDGTRWKLPRWRIAELLSLPVAGATTGRDRRAGRGSLVRQAAQERRARAGRRRTSTV